MRQLPQRHRASGSRITSGIRRRPVSMEGEPDLSRVEEIASRCAQRRQTLGAPAERLNKGSAASACCLSDDRSDVDGDRRGWHCLVKILALAAPNFRKRLLQVSVETRGVAKRRIEDRFHVASLEAERSQSKRAFRLPPRSRVCGAEPNENGWVATSAGRAATALVQGTSFVEKRLRAEAIAPDPWRPAAGSGKSISVR